MGVYSTALQSTIMLGVYSTILCLTIIGLTRAQTDCSNIGTSCASGCSCPTGTTCLADPADGLQYCSMANVAQGGYCDNHFGVCATGFTCALADSTSFVKTCIVPPTTTTTSTTTTSTTTTTTTNTTTTTTSTTISTTTT